jgi:hypothetical protein
MLQYAIIVNAAQAGPMSILENRRLEAFALTRQVDRLGGVLTENLVKTEYYALFYLPDGGHVRPTGRQAVADMMPACGQFVANQRPASRQRRPGSGPLAALDLPALEPPEPALAFAVRAISPLWPVSGTPGGSVRRRG